MLSECFQFSFEVAGIPEEHLIKVLTTYGPDQPFNEGVRQRYLRNGLDFLYFKNTQIHLPGVILK